MTLHYFRRLKLRGFWDLVLFECGLMSSLSLKLELGFHSVVTVGAFTIITHCSVNKNYSRCDTYLNIYAFSMRKI
jgi:hypothetical protein